MAAPPSIATTQIRATAKPGPQGNIKSLPRANNSAANTNDPTRTLSEDNTKPFQLHNAIPSHATQRHATPPSLTKPSQALNEQGFVRRYFAE